MTLDELEAELNEVRIVDPRVQDALDDLIGLTRVLLSSCGWLLWVDAQKLTGANPIYLFKSDPGCTSRPRSNQDNRYCTRCGHRHL